MGEQRRLINRNDPAVILLLLSLALAAMLLMWRYMNFSDKAEVYRDGELIKTVSLEKDSVFWLDGENGDYPHMEFEVSNKKIRVVSADCRDKICIGTGTIKRNYRTIICIPNRVVVKIAEKTDDNDIDVVL